jgi:hypothetical protein
MERAYIMLFVHFTHVIHSSPYKLIIPFRLKLYHIKTCSHGIIKTFATDGLHEADCP